MDILVGFSTNLMLCFHGTDCVSKTINSTGHILIQWLFGCRSLTSIWCGNQNPLHTEKWNVVKWTLWGEQLHYNITLKGYNHTHINWRFCWTAHIVQWRWFIVQWQLFNSSFYLNSTTIILCVQIQISDNLKRLYIISCRLSCDFSDFMHNLSGREKMEKLR